MMHETTPITTALTRMITAGELVARVVRRFPELTPAELSQALQVATAAAERQASRRH